MKKFFKELKYEKIQINWNKNPIEMEQFLSFFNVEVKKYEGDFLGKCMGWTKYVGENNLKIMGGKVGGKEYLDNIQYKKNLDNPYNNYVNPFYLFEIMTEEGQEFFLNYYREDIQKNIQKAYSEATKANKIARAKTKERDYLVEFWEKYEITLDKSK